MDSSESSANITPVGEPSVPISSTTTTTTTNNNNNSNNSNETNSTNSIAKPVVNPLDNLSQIELRKKLDSSRNELRKALDKKKRIDKDLASLENSIYAFEGSYLSDSLLPATASAGNTNVQFGNIIKGYDSYLKAPPTGADRKRSNRGAEGEVRDTERIFSRSSATHLKAVELRSAELVESGGAGKNNNNDNSASEEEESVSTGPGRKRRKNRD